MSSVQTHMKQSKGYFLVVGSTLTVAYTYSGGTGAGGSFVPGTMTLTTVSVVANSVLRDMGKTVFVGPLGTLNATAVPTAGQNQRVFRKVQWLDHGLGVATSGTLNPSNGVNSGSVGTPQGYDTFYIELPTDGQAGAAGGVVATNVVYVPGMPGLF